MPNVMTNNKANVSTTRGVQGGYIFRAATTNTDIPTAATFTPDDDYWTCLGYISEDGFTESVSQDSSTSLRDLNLDLVDEISGTFTETLTLSLMEVAAAPLSTIYGTQNVTETSGAITVDHNWSKTDESFQFCLLLLLKNDRKWVKFIPEGKITSRGDFTGNKTTAAQREITITYVTDGNGSGCKDYYAAVS